MRFPENVFWHTAICAVCGPRISDLWWYWLTEKDFTQAGKNGSIVLPRWYISSTESLSTAFRILACHYFPLDLCATTLAYEQPLSGGVCWRLFLAAKF
jgi:hypothetical protein